VAGMEKLGDVDGGGNPCLRYSREMECRMEESLVIN